MTSYLEVAIESAREAGKIQLALSKSELKFEMKDPRDILAEGDLKSEKIILGAIRKNFPGHDIWSEEAGKSLSDSEYLWLIDPIDGTINFARGLEDYCVSIGLQHKGKIIMGMIYQPVTGKLYTAEKGHGSFLNGNKIHVSKETEIINTLIATDNTSKNEKQLTNFQLLQKISTQFRQIRIYGSVAIHLVKIAEGKLDIYFKNGFNYWDCAAALLILEEAGGSVTDFDGNDFSAESKNILATNGLVHQDMLELLKLNL
jgi:myo-inositol-1(or 4)-monophosphatase